MAMKPAWPSENWPQNPFTRFKLLASITLTNIANKMPCEYRSNENSATVASTRATPVTIIHPPAPRITLSPASAGPGGPRV